MSAERMQRKKEKKELKSGKVEVVLKGSVVANTYI
jgi:hypothetical protein